MQYNPDDYRNPDGTWPGEVTPEERDAALADLTDTGRIHPLGLWRVLTDLTTPRNVEPREESQVDSAEPVDSEATGAADTRTDPDAALEPASVKTPRRSK